mmetsp:Transcript_24975/g.80135  ORF Transcript_24975/g.80135 Transcript_24975/m.80135 type:complete len:259 (+) Transcript_24975:64-840(+)
MGVVSACLPHYRVSPAPGNRGGCNRAGAKARAPQPQRHTEPTHSTYSSYQSWYYQQAQPAVRAPHLFAPGCTLAPAKVSGSWRSVAADGVMWGLAAASCSSLCDNPLTHTYMSLYIVVPSPVFAVNTAQSPASWLVADQEGPLSWRARTLCLALPLPSAPNITPLALSLNRSTLPAFPAARAVADGCASVVRITWRRSRYSQPKMKRPAMAPRSPSSRQRPRRGCASPPPWRAERAPRPRHRCPSGRRCWRRRRARPA